MPPLRELSYPGVELLGVFIIPLLYRLLDPRPVQNLEEHGPNLKYAPEAADITRQGAYE